MDSIKQIPEELFDIENETILNMFEKEPDYYYSVFLLRSNSTCHLKVSNVVPSPLSPRRPSSRVYKSDADCRLAAQKTDQLLLTQERQIEKTQEYFEMRSSQMESEESFFSSDHLSLSHVRQVYSGIRVLEHRIVSILYSRMQSDPCFSSALHRYDDMASRLGGNKTEKEEAAKEKIRDRLQHNDMPIQESFVNATYWRNIRRWRSTLHKLYEGTSFYTDENALCDGCFSDIPIKSFKPNPTYYNHFQLRKWVGDEEVFDISTSDNRHVMFSYS